MKEGLIIVSIFLILLSSIGMIESSKLERTMKVGIGVSFLPFSMSALVGFLAVILLISHLMGRFHYEDRPVFQKENLSRVILLGIALGIYIFLTDIIGYAISTFLFLFTTILILGRYRIIKVLISAALFTFILYGIFKLWLKTPLPTGLLGI